MDRLDPSSPQIPRLRVMRSQSTTQLDNENVPNSQSAGPSRVPHTITDNDSEIFDEGNDPDAQATPKVHPTSSIHPLHSLSTTDTPAARLRAVLSRVPHNNAKPSQQERPPAPPSEVDSDFDPPRFTPATPSIARESLKDLFSRALREPGDTPRKERRRRNSIDTSEVEASPRVDRERAKNKGKRRSLSDEEREGPSRSFQLSTTSSHAANLIALREKVERKFASSQKMSPISVEDGRYDGNDAHNVGNESNDTATFLRGLDSSQVTPPAAQSTPQRSLQLPSQSQSQSNLLENDSEMQKAMKELDSFDAGSDSSNHAPFPPVRPPAPTPRSSGHEKTTSLDRETHGKARMTGSLSRQGSRNSLDRPDRERTHSRTHLDIPSGSASLHPSKSSHTARPRTQSSISFNSIGSDSPSRSNSALSHSDHHDRETDRRKDHIVERERQWNKPHSTVTRPVSSLSLQSPTTERHRTISHPTRPDHVHLPLSPDRPVRQRHVSISSSDASSAEESTASRHAMREHETEILHEIDHDRERNWNAPHPKWDIHIRHLARPVSPMPVPSHATFGSPPHSHAHAHAPSRPRTESANSVHSDSRKSPELRRSPVKSPPPSSAPRSTIKSPGLSRSTSHPPRPHSPLPPVKQQNGNNTLKDSPASSSRPTWQFPRSRSPLPPLELESDDVERPASRNSPSPILASRSKPSHSPLPSRIPVKTPQKPTVTPSPDTNSQEQEHELPPTLNTPSVTSSANEATSMPPDSDNSNEPGESDSSEPPQISTPIVRRAEISVTPPPEPRVRARDEARLQRLASSAIVQEVSPPPTPSAPQPPSQPPWVLSTPPRPPSFTTTRIQFQSPSPPNDIPDLPEPPSISESEDESGQSREDHSDGIISDEPIVTAFATPRPPGAWASTPAHPTATTDDRVFPLPAEVPAQNGLATPVPSLSRATSLPLQTPAPPGGWMATPNRKSILKVRFDVEKPNSEASNEEPTGVFPGKFEDSSVYEGRFNTDVLVGENGIVSPTPVRPVGVHDDSLGRPSTPVSREPPIPVSPRSRKSPSIRVVDEFGRERVSEPVKSHANGSAVVDDVSRSKTTIKIVDAMGREMPEGDNERTNEIKRPLKRGEALANVQKGLADLANELDDEDRSVDDQVDKELVSKLQEESREARNIRAKILQSLATVRKADVDIRSKYTSLRTSLRRSNRFMLDAWTLWTLFTVQIVIALIMYRISSAHARSIYLTTYYDPFYPDHHVYPGKLFTYSISSPSFADPPMSISAIFKRDGWLALLPGLWNNFLALLSAWQTHAWESLDTSARGYGQTMSWPPT